MVESMANHKNSSDRSGWDDVRLQNADRTLANVQTARSPTPEGVAPFKHSAWSHVRWILLITVMVLGAGYSMSRYLKERTSQQGERVDRGTTPVVGRQITTASSLILERRLHLRREPEHQQHTDSSEPKPAYISKATALEIGGNCINGRVFKVRRAANTTEIYEDRGLRCYQ